MDVGKLSDKERFHHKYLIHLIFTLVFPSLTDFLPLLIGVFSFHFNFN